MEYRFFMKMSFYFVFLSFISTQIFAKNVHVKLALNWKAEPEFGGFYAAQIEKFFEKAGLDVEILEGGVGTPVTQMVASGKVEFGIVAADEVVISQDRGSDVVGLFAVYQKNPQNILTHQERGFKSILDIFNNEGFVAVIQGLPYVDYLKSKSPNAKVKIVPFQGGVTQLMAEKKMASQGYDTVEPILAQRKGLKVQSFIIADAGFDPYGTLLSSRQSYLNKNSELTKKFVKACRLGWEHYLKSPEKVNKLILKLNPTLDKDLLKQSMERQKVFIESEVTKEKGLGTMTEERWKTLSQQLQDLKLLQKKPKNAQDYFKNL